ncbi:hypothetical protein DM02DRAFT_627880 [Periconia macrospinosa]|uniref:Uncharacterized protein n=1 Tax=Periconia macrospinosa TaxID=97972 RepID=A0A2V1DTJ7_9PLEO|nr:hypothetical protein DM02DRAFT_627880 [Periconia macrospinosa]
MYTRTSKWVDMDINPARQMQAKTSTVACRYEYLRVLTKKKKGSERLEAEAEGRRVALRRIQCPDSSMATYPTYTPPHSPAYLLQRTIHTYIHTYPITRVLILAHLRDADHDPYRECLGDEHPALVNHAQTSLSHATDGSLRQAIRSLQTLYEQERSTTDWSPEYDKPPSCHVLRQNDDSTLDTSILKRIAEGRGPRDAKYEDLIAPLRLTKRSDLCTGQLLYNEETYDDLLRVLLDWNRKVAPIHDLSKERQDLATALKARNALIDKAAEHNTLRLLNQPFPQLREALCAFRPEITRFENQNISDLMVLMVANMRIARPDIDDDIKHAIFETLFKESIVRMLFERSFRGQKAESRMQQKSAKDKEDWDKVYLLKEREREVERQSKAQRASQIIDRVKSARGNLYNKNLLALLELAMMQTAQMEAAAVVHSGPSILFALEQGSRTIHDEELWSAEGKCRRSAEDMDRMLGLIRDCIHRTKRFAALDVADAAERAHIREDRMEKPGTASMMMKVVEDTNTIRGISGNVLKRMRQIEMQLGVVLGEATERYRLLLACDNHARRTE